MPYFVIQTHPQLPLVVAKVVQRKPKSTDKDGFYTRYIAAVDDQATEGAEAVIEMLDEAMGDARKGPGVYQASYEAVRSAYGEIIASRQAPRHHVAVRIASGVAALLLTIAFTAAVTLGTIAWLFVSAFKKQSGLLTMAETAVLWSIFDWRPLIRKLARIAYGK